MTNIQLSTPVYIAGAVFGFVLIVVSLAVILVRPADVAQMAQNNISAVVATPVPALVAVPTATGSVLQFDYTVPIVGDAVVTVK